jgi:hypothetical protein
MPTEHLPHQPDAGYQPRSTSVSDTTETTEQVVVYDVDKEITRPVTQHDIQCFYKHAMRNADFFRALRDLIDKAEIDRQSDAAELKANRPPSSDHPGEHP